MKDKKVDKSKLLVPIILGVGALGIVVALIWAGVSSKKEAPDSSVGVSDGDAGDDVSGEDVQYITFIDADGTVHYEVYDPNDPNNIVDNFKFFEDERIRNEYDEEEDSLGYELVNGDIIKRDKVSDDLIFYENEEGEMNCIPDAVPVYHIIDENQMYACNGELTISGFLSGSNQGDVLDSYSFVLSPDLKLSDFEESLTVEKAYADAAWNVGLVRGTGEDRYSNLFSLFCKETDIVDLQPVLDENPYWSSVNIYPTLRQFVQGTEDSEKSRYYQNPDDKFVFNEYYYFDIDGMVELFGEPYASEYHWSTGLSYLWRTDSDMYITFTEQPNLSGSNSSEICSVISIYNLKHKGSYNKSNIVEIYEGTEDFEYITQ